MVIDLTAHGLDNASDSELNDMFPYYIDYGTKSTVSAMRLKSVSEDESEVSTAYVVAKDEQGKIAELRSLPNGVKDEVRLSDGKMVKRVSDEIMITGATLTAISPQYSDTYDRLDFKAVNLINAVEFNSAS